MAISHTQGSTSNNRIGIRLTVATKPETKQENKIKRRLRHQEEEEKDISEDQLHGSLIEIAEAGVVDENNEEEEV